MKINEIDIATRIFNLSLEIKLLVRENNIPIRVVIEDFIDLLESPFEENMEIKECLH